MNRLVYYVSGHGLGHAVRASEVILALRRLRPDAAVRVRTTAPPGFLANLLGPEVSVEPLGPESALDLGLVQTDSLRPDHAASLERALRLLDRAPAVIESEAAVIRGWRADGVAADIPFLAPAAARAAGTPSVVTANFTWDWIYRDFIGLDPRWAEAADRIREYYRLADLAVRFPMSPDLTPTFGPVPVEPAGYTGRKARRPAADVRRQLGLAPDRPLALLTFNDLRLSPAAARRLAESTNGFVFVYSANLDLPRPPFIRVDHRTIGYPDLVGAADLVLTKPGYGIVCDCLANQTPMVYTDRGRFPEYPYLEDAIRRELPHRYIPSEEVYAGNLAPFLTDPRPPQQPTRPAQDGASRAAALILKTVEP